MLEPVAIVSVQRLQMVNLNDFLQVGISAEFPSGSYAKSNLDHTAFFDFLLKRGESYEKIPRERFNIDS